jgi:predicted nuclease of predicted toxin-antitoxin system
MKLLVDMNLSPDWVPVLEAEGWSAIHWSAVGNPRATDAEIMAWASQHDYVVLTHDLDFGTALALSQAGKPSVLQVRVQDVAPDALRKILVSALRQFTAELGRGALVVVDESRARARVLPLTP